MNKKDCEHLGYLLSQHNPINWELCKAIFAMDDRIEQEYNGFREVQGMSDEVDELTEKLMLQHNGPGAWGPLKKTYGECLEEARKEIYGDDYSSWMFK